MLVVLWLRHNRRLPQSCLLLTKPASRYFRCNDFWVITITLGKNVAHGKNSQKNKIPLREQRPLSGR